MAMLSRTPGASQTWEAALFSLADDQAIPSPPGRVLSHEWDRAVLERAHAHCDELARTQGRTFYLAAALLPAEKRRAMRALYAFCRISDNLVDGEYATEQAAARLVDWRQRATSPAPPADDLVAVAWTDARSRFAIPVRYAEQLLSGVERDLHQRRYATFADLATYCYGVASTVGLMSMHIIGFSSEAAIPYAIKLGVALQLTNILRDVGEDWRAGRLYLPLDELVAFGLTQADLQRGQVDDRWRALMRFQIARNRRLYAEAWPGIALLSRDGRFAIAAAAALYRAILNDIEAHDYDVFHRRAHVSRWGMVRRLPGIWWRSRKGRARVRIAEGPL